MIKIGLTGWGDHNSLYQEGTTTPTKLRDYSSHFPVVEVDSSFYAMQPLRNYRKWVNETPDIFSFVIKAYQGMTGHSRGETPYGSLEEMFDLFTESIEPVIKAGKLEMVLFQYPPWFDCQKKHVDMLRYTKQKMGNIPVALEFRNQSWFLPHLKEKTLHFMEDEGWIHCIVDEPQAGSGSIPTVLHPTDAKQTLVRFHGRNVQGWNSHGNPNWREVRYLYRYNSQELAQWKENVEQLHQHSNDIIVLFNNNSGGDAADNAKELLSLLGIEYNGLAPRQMNLFE